MRRLFNKQYVVASYDPKYPRWEAAQADGSPFAARLVYGIEEARRQAQTFADVYRALGGAVTGSYKTEYTVDLPNAILRCVRIEENKS